MSEVTDWISCETPPLRSRPGGYDVRYRGMGVASWVVRIHWDGRQWRPGLATPPSSAWGDEWRGATEKQA